MTEPTLNPGETWEDFWESRMQQRHELDCTWPTAEPWERDQMRAVYDRLRFELACAERHLEHEFDEVLW